MTLSLLKQCLWKEEVLADCGSLERFFDIGFGVCGVMDGRVVSEAYASVPGDRAYEIRAIVHPEFRRRDLAYLTCAALIDDCRRRKYDTIWSCHRRRGWRGSRISAGAIVPALAAEPGGVTRRIGTPPRAGSRSPPV